RNERARYAAPAPGEPFAQGGRATAVRAALSIEGGFGDAADSRAGGSDPLERSRTWLDIPLGLRAAARGVRIDRRSRPLGHRASRQGYQRLARAAPRSAASGCKRVRGAVAAAEFRR